MKLSIGLLPIVLIAHWDDDSGRRNRRETAFVYACPDGAARQLTVRAYDFAAGVQRWEYDAGGSWGGRTWPPHVQGDRVVLLGSRLGVRCLDLRNGRLVWEVALNGINDWAPGSNAAFVATKDEVVCLSLDSGEARWKVGGGATHGGFKKSAERLVRVTEAGRVEALDSVTGKVLWGVEAQALAGRLAVLGGSVITGSGPDGKVLGLSEITGETLWSVDSFGKECAPWVIRDRLYLTNLRSELRAVDPATGRILWAFHGGGWIEKFDEKYLFLSNLGGSHHCLEAATGQALWSRQPAATNIWLGGPDVILEYRGRLFEPRSYVAVDPVTRREYWTRPINRSRKLQPKFDRDRLYLCLQETADSASSITCVDSKTGQVHWSQSVDGEFMQLSLVQNRLVLAMKDKLVCLERGTGKVAMTIACKRADEVTVWESGGK